MRYVFMRFPEFKAKTFTLSYDDGNMLDTNIIDRISKTKIKCEFNLNSGLFGNEIISSSPLRAENRRASGKECFELYKNYSVAVHGKMHLAPVNCTDTEFLCDVIEDKKNLEKLFDRQIIGYVYPDCGGDSEDAKRIIKYCGFKYARIARPSLSFDMPTDWFSLQPTCHHSHEQLGMLLDKFVEFDENKVYEASAGPKMMLVWGHAHDYDRVGDWSPLDAICEKVGNLKDVWYATLPEIKRYVEAYESLERNADDTLFYNPSATDVYLNVRGKNVLVKSGQTVRL